MCLSLHGHHARSRAHTHEYTHTRTHTHTHTHTTTQPPLSLVAQIDLSNVSSSISTVMFCLTAFGGGGTAPDLSDVSSVFTRLVNASAEPYKEIARYDMEKDTEDHALVLCVVSRDEGTSGKVCLARGGVFFFFFAVLPPPPSRQ